MAVKLNAEMVNFEKLVKKLGPELIKPDIDRAIGLTADDAAPMLQTLVGIRTGQLINSIESTGVSDRGRGKSRGTAATGLSASYVKGIYYGRWPDRGTRTINRRGWSVKARTQAKPAAATRLKAAGNSIARKWGK